MNLSAPFIKRPVATTLLAIASLAQLFGRCWQIVVSRNAPPEQA